MTTNHGTEQSTPLSIAPESAEQRLPIGLLELLVPIGSLDESSDAFGGSGETVTVERWRSELRAVVNAVPAAEQNPAVVVARWAVTMLNPLVATQERVAAEEAMMALVGRNPDWMAAYCAGVLHEVVTSLPRDDPWRNLTSVIDLDMLTFGHPTSEENPRRIFKGPRTAAFPEKTGAMLPNGTIFGTIESAFDLRRIGADDDPLRDVAMAPLYPNLSPLSAAMIAFAGDSARYLRDMMSHSFNSLWKAYMAQTSSHRASELFLHNFTAALRWVTWRRQVYVGPFDHFVESTCFQWITKAERVVSGETENIQREIETGEGAIDDSMYATLAGINSNDLGFDGF